MPSLDPRLSSRWIAWITLATRIVCLPLPSHLAQSTSSDIALDLCFPPTFSQSWCSKGLLHESALVSYLVSLFLVACLQKFQTFLDLTNITAFNTSRHARKLTEQLADPKTVVTLLQKAVTESDVSKTEANLHLHTLLRLLLFYYQLAPELTASLRFDFTKLLEPILGHSASSSATMLSCQFTLLQLYMLPGVQVQWLKGSGSAMPIYMLCQVLLCSPESAIQQQAAVTISRILSHSNLFEPDQSAEIAIWVNALRASTTEESETISSLFSASLQKASNSVFKCIEETEDLDLSSNQPCSPLIAGWLQQLDYVRQHSKNDQHEHVAKFSARVVAGYAASHTLNSGLTLQKKVKRLVSKAWRSPLQLPSVIIWLFCFVALSLLVHRLASLPESHAVEDTVTWDITRISSDPGIWNHRSVSEINSLRARLAAALWLASPSDRTSKDLIMAIANLLTQGQDLDEKAVEDVIAPMCRELVKTSKDNDEFLAG